MTSEELWQILERLDNKNILVISIMCIRYLVKNRQLNYKDVLQEIKKAYKKLD